MIFSQFVDADLGCASYLVGDEDAGVAVVVDPPYAVEPVLAEAARRGVSIERTIETHTHADHVSGHGRLALDLGVPVSIHPAAEAEYEHDPLSDGATVAAGAVELRCLHTPGHRPEHCCLAVTDRSRADEPWLVLTGDSLFVGDAARPDLAGAAAEGAADLHRSLQRLLTLSDGVEVYPGHVAGSLCGKSLSTKASTTIGFERRFNPALALDSEAFVAESIGSSVPRPPNMQAIVQLNRGPFLGAPGQPPELPVPPEGVQVLDVRPAREYLAGHYARSRSVPAGGTSFATRAAYVLDAERPVVVVASSAEEAARAVRGLRSVGILEVAGTVLGGGDRRIEPVSVGELERLLEEGAEVLDVREQDERDSGYIPGTRSIPFRLLTVCGADVAADRPVVTICTSGARAVIAASILEGCGIEARPVVDGGVGDWRSAGGSMVEFRRCGA